MKLPRDLNGVDLARKLEAVGFVFLRQSGSHLMIKHTATGELIAVPGHRPLKVGTLSGILKVVVALTGLSRDELLKTIQ